MFLPTVSGAGTEYASYTSSPYTQYTSSPYAGYSYSTNGTSGLLSRYFAYFLELRVGVHIMSITVDSAIYVLLSRLVRLIFQYWELRTDVTITIRWPQV